MKILIVFGTRPEAIKFAPLIREFLLPKYGFKVVVCNTGQHKEMLDQVVDFFNIPIHYSLNVMSVNQTLASLTAKCLTSIREVIVKEAPDLVFVQGDTTTAFVAALAAFYENKRIAHLEAGLRSGDLLSPFPEEGNRKLISQLATLHLTPTDTAKKNLQNEGITKGVHSVGNTVIDALFLGLKLVEEKESELYGTVFKGIDFSKKIILVTAHRRESFGQPLKDICEALLTLANEHNDLQIVYPVHLNPNVRQTVHEILGGAKNVSLFSPFDYRELIWIMKKSHLILTDSGGIQEEAPSLGKPVLVMRNVTERTEGIEAGNAILVGTDKKKIIDQVSLLLTNNEHYTRISKIQNPYGDGESSARIAKIVSLL